MVRRKRQTDGIRMEAAGSGPESRTRMAGRALGQTALLGLSIIMTIRCIVTTLDMETEGMLYSGLLFFSVVWAGMYLIRGAGRLVLLGCYVIGVSAFVLTKLEEVGYGFIYLENSFITLANAYYKTELPTYVTHFEEAQAVTLFLLAAAQLFLAVYAQALFCGKPRFPALLLMGLSAFFSLGLGIIPAESALAGLLLCIVAVLAIRREHGIESSESAEGSAGGSAGNAVMAAVLAGLLCLIASLMIGEEFYRTSMRKPERKASLQSAFKAIENSSVWNTLTARLESIAGGGGKKADSAGGLDGGRFSRAERIEFKNRTALKVTMPYFDQSVYLKGYSGAVYTPFGWEQLDKETLREYRELTDLYGITAQELTGKMMSFLCEGELPLEWDARLQSLIRPGWQPDYRLWHGRMTVDYITANKRYIYGPYSYLPEEQEKINYKGDSYIFPENNKKTYTFEFYTGSSDIFEKFNTRNEWDEELLPQREWNPDWDEGNDVYMEFEREYRTFVYNAYTHIPEGHEQLRKLDLGVDEDDFVWKRVKAVVRFLSYYQYTLAPGSMPEEADFVDYFLFENKKGYCVHFASAAVLLLRTLGVPARYAEGYLISESDIAHAAQVGQSELLCYGKTPSWGDFKQEDVLDPLFHRGIVPERMVEVRDYSAHAWVEIYLNGLGWVPVEVTSGFSGGSVQRLPSEILDEAEKAPSPTPLPTNTPAPVRPVGRPSPQPTAVPTAALPPEASAAPTGAVIPPVLPDGTQGPGTPSDGSFSFARWWRGLLPAVRWMLSACAVFFLAAAAVFLRYRAVLRYRNRKCSGRRRVLELYERMEQLLRLEPGRDGPELVKSRNESYEAFASRVLEQSIIAGEDFRDCQELALRTAFGGTRPTPEELGQLVQSLAQMRKKLFSSVGMLRRIYLKFLKIC